MIESKTRRILINPRIGCFLISRKALNRMIELGSTESAEDLRMSAELNEESPGLCPLDDPTARFSLPISMERDDPIALQVFDELGDEFSCGFDGRIHVVEIPIDVDWEVWNDDPGNEWVAEKHRKWFAK